MEKLQEFQNEQEKQYYLSNYYKENFEHFIFDALGYEDLNQQHRELCQFIQYNKKKFKLILMPRYTFKSSIATIGYTLWRLTKNPNTRVRLSAAQAIQSMAAPSEPRWEKDGPAFPTMSTTGRTARVLLEAVDLVESPDTRFRLALSKAIEAMLSLTLLTAFRVSSRER